MRAKWLILITLVSLMAAGFGVWTIWQGMQPPTPESFFKDVLTSNTQEMPEPFALQFRDREGNTVTLADYHKKSNLVLVVMRGYPNEVCQYCAAQTSRLIRQHSEFARRDAEVLMVFPGPTENLLKFIAAGEARAGGDAMPFRLVLDPEFNAVDKLGIRGSLAKPSTYILDKSGRVRFAYVGAYTSDRPSLKCLLEQLDAIQSGQGPS
jgi:peroxiredoxin